MVLFAAAVVGTVFATVGAMLFAGTTTLLTRRVPVGRRRAIFAAAIFPFICLGWGACVFVFQAVVNELLLDRDLGIGDTWHTRVPNGYQIMMIDVTDQGWVYNPKTQPMPSENKRTPWLEFARYRLQVNTFLEAWIAGRSITWVTTTLIWIPSSSSIQVPGGKQSSRPTMDCVAKHRNDR